MPPLLTLLCTPSESTFFDTLAKLAEWYGLTTVTVEVRDEVRPSNFFAKVKRDSGHLMITSSALSRLCSFNSLRGEDLCGLQSVFVFGFDRDSRQVPLHLNHLFSISDRAFLGVKDTSQDEMDCRLSSNVALTFQLAGLSFKTFGSQGAVFQTSDNDQFDSVIASEHGTLLARTRQNDCEIYLLAGSDICDIDDPVALDVPDARYYPGLLPWLLYFRRVFDDFCWHSSDSHATLIIDDPLIKPRHGFLRYDQLIDEMHVHGFKAAIAHIPWNYSRANTDTAAMLRRNADCLSICVHGCDHTNAEFGISDVQVLREKAHTAIEWSNRLERQTGLAIDPIMIFPQGVFSRTAIPIVSREGFLAAINTSRFPIDYADGDISIRDLFDVAITKYSAFPIFGRRYPFQLFPLAFDLFLGKPAFVAQHHIDFKNGYSKLTRFLDEVTELEPQPSWAALEDAVTHSGLQKRESARRYRVKYYSDRFVLRNHHSCSMTYTLSKRIDPEAPVPRIVSNGRGVGAQVRGDSIEFELLLDAGATANISTMGASTPPELNINRTIGYETKVAARRFLSDFRDNYLAQSDGLFRFSKAVQKILPL